MPAGRSLDGTPHHHHSSLSAVVSWIGLCSEASPGGNADLALYSIGDN